MTLDDLIAKVTLQTGVVNSNTTLLQELSAYIHTHGNDPVKMQALADGLTGNTQAILDAIAANPVPGVTGPSGPTGVTGP
jgi:hypothetical protein